MKKETKFYNGIEIAGDHYQVPIQPIEYIHRNSLSFDEGNVVKYITRHKRKNGYDDVLKAIHYCLFIMQRDYGLDSGTIDDVLGLLTRDEER